MNRHAQIKDKTILLAAGGTGGHFFPALSFASTIAKSIKKVHIVHDDRVSHLVKPGANLEFHQIKIQRSSGSLISKIRSLCTIIKDTINCIKLIRKIKPDIVMGFGGYPCIPSLLAGIVLRKTILLHEQNTTLGRTNKLFERFAKIICTGFPDLLNISNRIEEKIIYTGNPLRQNIAIQKQPHQKNKATSPNIQILVTGGSQGANIMSQIVPQAISLLDTNIKKQITVFHQTRKDASDISSLKNLYKKMGVRAHIETFFEDMHQLLKNTDIVIGRAGAGTISEITASGRASILVPIKNSIFDHQFHNANFLCAHDACILIQETHFKKEILADKIKTLILDTLIRQQMAQNAHSLGIKDAHTRCAKVVINLLA